MLIFQKKVKLLRNIELGVVIPIFKHSVYVNESIISVLEQKIDWDFVIVLINDGCSHKETDDVCRLYATAFAKKVFYIRKQNGGLSSARNAGIEFLLNKFDSIQAIYFLDADNRLMPYALQKAWGVLQNTPKNVGWAYPDIDMFAKGNSIAVANTFSSLQLLYQNYCDAGSMVKRDVFEAGICYDENMTLGYEDWEFYLQAVAKGFRGIHISNMGFQYRKRPESMLVNSMRNDLEIKSYIQRKHKNLFSMRTLLQLEHKEAPRYAIFQEEEYVDYCIDPNIVSRYELLQHIEDFFQAFFSPYGNHTPPISVFSTRDSIDALKKIGLLHWLLWKVDSVLNHKNSIIVVKLLTSEDNNLTIDIKYGNSCQKCLKQADLIFMKSRFLFEKMAKHNRNIKSDIHKEIDLISICLPMCNSQVDKEAARYYGNFLERIGLVYKRYKETFLLQSDEWRMQSYIEKNELNTIPKRLSRCNSIYPIVSFKKRIGFVFSNFLHDEMEKILMHLAQALKQNGFSIHLFFIDRMSIHFYTFQNSYDTIGFLFDDSKQFRSESRYPYPDVAQKAFEALSSMDCVINVQCKSILEVMGRLKQHGVTTIDFVYSCDNSYEKSCEDDILYEHGLKHYIVVSKNLKTTLHSRGIPFEKISLIPLAPLYDIYQEKLLQIQKCKVVEKYEALKVVLVESCNIDTSRNQNIIYKHLNNLSLLQNDELSALYIWADCVFFPNYNTIYLPHILDVMRYGTIPFCFGDSDAFEIIKHKNNGFIFRNQSYTSLEEVNGILKKLQKDPSARNTIQRSAIQTAKNFSWSQTVKCFKNLLLKG